MAFRAVEKINTENKKNIPKNKKLIIPDWMSGEAEDVDELVVIYHNWDEIRRLMWDYVSIVRTNKRLKRAATRLLNLRKEVHEFYWNFLLRPQSIHLLPLELLICLVIYLIIIY